MEAVCVFKARILSVLLQAGMQCVAAGINGQMVFLNGLLEVGEERKLKVKRAASLALCQDCLWPKGFALSDAKAGASHRLHGHPFNSSCRAFGRFKWTQIHLSCPSAACLQGNRHILVADLTVWLDLLGARLKIKDDWGFLEADTLSLSEERVSDGELWDASWKIQTIHPSEVI